MQIYLRILSILYGIGAFLHLLDVFDLRLEFSSIPFGWKPWILFLLVADAAAAIGLWRQKVYGEVLFLIIAVSQVAVYSMFNDYFGEQLFLIGFHVVIVGIYLGLKVRSSRMRAQVPLRTPIE